MYVHPFRIRKVDVARPASILTMIKSVLVIWSLFKNSISCEVIVALAVICADIRSIKHHSYGDQQHAHATQFILSLSLSFSLSHLSWRLAQLYLFLAALRTKNSCEPTHTVAFHAVCCE